MFRTDGSDGGAAFPRLGDITFDASEGMSLRDYFAAKAMHSLLSEDGVDIENIQNIPKASYLLADEMLKERGK